MKNGEAQGIVPVLMKMCVRLREHKNFASSNMLTDGEGTTCVVALGLSFFLSRSEGTLAIHSHHARTPRVASDQLSRCCHARAFWAFPGSAWPGLFERKRGEIEKRRDGVLPY